ncbi:MAG: cytochrome c oxidase subunit II [Alphaproteobacteria bacterium]|nr:cytochrome c oxidase subunit II [Alphaproteobacteria bacterium]
MTNIILRFSGAATAALATGLSSAAALASEPMPWQLNLPTPVTPVAQMQYDFHTYWLLPIITIIAVLVLALLLYTCFRFRESANPTPSRTTHNSLLEVLWTGIPIIILVVLAFPSFSLLYASDRVEDPDMTLKIIGNQWYWSYEYPDHGNFTFDAILAAREAEDVPIAEEEYGRDILRLMDTDNLVVLPEDTKIRLIMTSNDVLHNWAVSDFGVRMDTVPGRLNETWMMVEEPGLYYGFCSELCGVDHAYMPIAVKIVTKPEFEAWVQQAQQEFDTVDGTPVPSAEKQVQLAETVAQ